ncbi:MAG TPA: 50S ribosomal protein L32 [Blastocatellia bacterium]|nr:50S ribosomal protein L32 [Blastocatellia bacterium]
MPNPKRRHSKSRSRKRRTHDALSRIQLSNCTNCGNKKLSHRVCSRCGFYDGRTVIEVKEQI